MAHSLSAKKRVRQNAKKRVMNRARKSAVKTQIKKFQDLDGTEPAAVEKEFRSSQKKIDQLVAKGVIHKNTAARKKAQLARQLNASKTKA